MGTATVKRPLLIYALVFTLGLALAVVTVASYGLIYATRAIHWDAADAAAHAMARTGNPAQVRAGVDRARKRGFARVYVVTGTVTAMGIDINGAREAVADPGYGRARGFAAAMILSEGPSEEGYVVYRPSPGGSLGIIRSQIRLFVLVGGIGAVLAGLLLTFMVSRLVLSPLSALRNVAESADLTDLAAGDAPNEISEIARTFRRTVRKLNEEREEIERQHAELERMQQSLVRASKLASVGRLAAGIAHEMGNPLAAVRGYMALMPRLEEHELKEVLERSQRELTRMHETIQKLLTYARKDEEAETVPLKTKTIVEEALALVRGHPAMRGAEIEDRVPELEAADASGQAGPLGQVLVNLLLNAAQASRDADDRRITIERVQAKDDAPIQIRVRDRGPGVAEETIEQIFDPFFTTKPPGEGTGLGLAVSRSLMERMDGDLTYETPDGPGACFVVSLPNASVSPTSETEIETP